MSKTTSNRIIAVIVVIGLLASVYFAWPMISKWSKPATDDSKQTAQAPKVTVALPLVMPIVEWDEYIGRMAAVEAVEVRARVSGSLEAHYFEEGDTVQEGDRLFLVDPRPFEAALAEAKAALSEAEAASTEAKAAEYQSQAQRKQVEARVDLATVQLSRLAKLVKSRSISADEYDVMKSEKQQASADLQAADAAISSAEASSTAAEAAIDSAKARVQTAELQLSFTVVHAPISGRIGRRLVTKGNLITDNINGSTLLTTIVSVDPIHCTFEANERELLKYVRLDRSGERESSRTVKNPVFMSLIDEDGFPHEGHMDFVDNRIDAQTGTIRGRAIFPNPDKVLAPGMFAELRLPGSARYEATLIPDSAIGRDQAEQFLMIVGDDNKIERRSVKLGPLVHGLRVVRSGLEPNERIVTRGLQRARQGEEVSPEVETIEATKGEGLPDDYTPIPEDQWLTPKPSMSMNSMEYMESNNEQMSPTVPPQNSRPPVTEPNMETSEPEADDSTSTGSAPPNSASQTFGTNVLHSLNVLPSNEGHSA